MAKAKDLAGLAALGALGYMLTRDKDSKPTRGAGYQSTETREEPRRKIEDYMAKAPADPREAGIAAANDVRSSSGTRGGSSLSSVKEEDTPSEDTAPLKRATPGGEAKRTEGGKPMPSLRSVERKVADQRASKATRQQQLSTRKLAPTTAASRRDVIDQIPGQNRSGPEGGERVSGTELSRNVSNTINALAPLGGGVGKIGAELATAGRAQRGYNAAQAARRSAEGMSPTEALAAKEAAAQAAREAKTLNPNAWMAGPKGMAENFRKGGAVKKMASGGMTASSRADGIASRGKTKCKMY
jgi:hypothetical protein